MPEFQSQIPESQINRLIERVQSRNYGKYLYKIVLSSVRGFENQIVNFDFPVTALIGPNGGGKTTILGAAGCAYSSVPPRRFFTKSGRFDDSMQNWSIRYEIIDREISFQESVYRTASFRSYKWYRSALEREVEIFGIARTVPANERPEFRKCASNRYHVEADRIEGIGPDIADAVGRILGKDVSQYAKVRVDELGRVSLLTGATEDGVQYSEFHFGAGESSVIKMVMAIEALPKNSLVLIEEIENGFHPIATIRMVEYLIELAERKRIQTIFTTHSNDALEPLPAKGIWAALGDRVVQGKLDIDSLRAITGQLESQLVVYTEDEFAKMWVTAALRAAKEIDMEMIEVHPMGGDDTAVEMNRSHNLNPSIGVPSVCFIDGDSQQQECEQEHIYRLPGELPETYIYDFVMDRLHDVSGVLAVALHQQFESQERVSDVVRDVRRTNFDHHLLFTQVGKHLGLIPPSAVRDAFLFVWAQNSLEEVECLVAPIRTRLAEQLGTRTQEPR